MAGSVHVNRSSRTVVGTPSIPCPQLHEVDGPDRRHAGHDLGVGEWCRRNVMESETVEKAAAAPAAGGGTALNRPAGRPAARQRDQQRHSGAN